MKLIRRAAVLLGLAAAGILVWRKVESDRLRNDLWAEAESVSLPQPTPRVTTTTGSIPAPRA